MSGRTGGRKGGGGGGGMNDFLLSHLDFIVKFVLHRVRTFRKPHQSLERRREEYAYIVVIEFLSVIGFLR